MEGKKQSGERERESERRGERVEDRKWEGADKTGDKGIIEREMNK